MRMAVHRSGSTWLLVTSHENPYALLGSGHEFFRPEGIRRAPSLVPVNVYVISRSRA